MRLCVATFVACCYLYPSATWSGDFLGLVNPATFGSNQQAFVRANAFAGSTFAPLREAATEQWKNYAPRSGNNFDVISVLALAGATWDHWMVGLLYRQDWVAQAGKETLDAYHAQKAGLPLQANEHFDIHYEVAGLEARGVAIGKSFSILKVFHQLNAGIQLNLMEGQRIKTQSASGRAIVTSASDLAVQGNTFNADSQMNTAENDFNPALQNINASGNGYSANFGLTYANLAGWQFSWVVADAFGEFQWRQVPQIDLHGSSVYNGQFPEGRKERVSLVQHLPIKQALTLSMPIGSFHFDASNNAIGAFNFPSLGIRQSIGDGAEIALDYDFTFQSTGLSYATQNARLSLRSDSTSLDHAKALAMFVAFSFPF